MTSINQGFVKLSEMQYPFINGRKIWPYKKYNLIPQTPKSFLCEPWSMPRIKKSLAQRNWFWGGADEQIKDRAVSRILNLLNKLDEVRLTKTYQMAVGQREVVSVATTGSFPWHDRPGDIDIYFIVKGSTNLTLEKLSYGEVNLLNIPIIPKQETINKIALQFMGLDNLRKAAMDKKVGRREELQRKLLTLYGNGVILAGLDIYDKTPPWQNFYLYQQLLERLGNSPDLDPAKKEKRSYEAGLVLRYIERIRQ